MVLDTEQIKSELLYVIPCVHCDSEGWVIVLHSSESAIKLTHLLFKSLLIYALLFSQLSLYVPGLDVFCRARVLVFSRIVHTTSNSSRHNSHNTVQRQERKERWTQNSITHVLQRCWFPGELSPALCPNPFSTWKVDKCVLVTSPLVFCLQADPQLTCCRGREIYDYRG